MTRLRYIGKATGERGIASHTAKITLPLGLCFDPTETGFRVVKHPHFHAADEPCATVRQGRDLIEIPDELGALQVRLLRGSFLRPSMGQRTRYQQVTR